MGVVERLARRLAADGSLVPGDVDSSLDRLRATEAPLLSEDQASAVVDTVLGLGPLQPLLREPLVSDVLVNSDGSVWVERSGRLEPADVRFDSPTQVVAVVERALAPLGLRLDRVSPAVDARLPDGSRLHAMIPPAAVDGPVVAIRRFTQTAATLSDLVELGSINPEGSQALAELVSSHANLVVCGATGSGKTTLLNVLGAEIDPGERIVTVEDAAELRLPGHVVRLEGRPANSEGAGAISLRDLLRYALRLRPDRLVVGEVRGAEAFDLIQALSTGHRGSMSTVHASSADEARWRMESLALLEPAATAAALSRQVDAVVDSVVVVGRKRGLRVVRTIEHNGAEVYRCS